MCGVKKRGFGILEFLLFILSFILVFLNSRAFGSNSELREDIQKLKKIEHIIIIYQENRSFDSLFGTFPGAEGIPPIEKINPQIDFEGKPYPELPRPRLQGEVDIRFPVHIANAPFNMEPYLRISPHQAITGDPVHRFYQNIGQIHGGRNDRFVAFANQDSLNTKAVGGLVMGHIDGVHLTTGKLAQEYVLCDHFFQSGFGGSSLNHFLLISGSPLYWQNPPSNVPGLIAKIDEHENLLEDGAVTPDGWLVNNIQSLDPNWMEGKGWPPYQTFTTIGDRLTEKGISWKWYAEFQNLIGLNPMASKKLRQDWYIAQPFRYFKNYALGTEEEKKHLVDYVEFHQDLRLNQVPKLSFIKLAAPFDEHPLTSPLLSGQKKVTELVKLIQENPIWDHSLIIITYDENGGFWDHVPPPARDEFGPGTRIPAIVISPFSKKSYVDNTHYETLSLLKMIETRFDLAPLNQRDANAPNFLGWIQ